MSAKKNMKIFKNNGRSWERTLLVDTFNNEILAHQATPIRGSTKPYYHCLEQKNCLNEKKYNLEHTNTITNSAGRRVWGFLGIEILARPYVNSNLR